MGTGVGVECGVQNQTPLVKNLVIIFLIIPYPFLKII